MGEGRYREEDFFPLKIKENILSTSVVQSETRHL